MLLTLLLTSPRVAPGLLSWGAWQRISAADHRLASDAGLPLAQAVSAAGHPVEARGPLSGAELMEAARVQSVVWLASDAEADRLPGELAAGIVGGSEVEIEVLHASYDVPGARLTDLVAVMDRLRRECPWDREQTHETLAPYLLEETYETLEAIEGDDPAHLREELGDLLLQVVFHARVAQESATADGGFDIDDVAGGIVDKLVHRHPHVFAGLAVDGTAEVEANWEELKRVEKQRTSVLEGVPTALPALALADKVLDRAARVGVAAGGPTDDPTDEVGDRLLALVATARAEGRDAEQSLRAAVRRLIAAVRVAETS